MDDPYVQLQAGSDIAGNIQFLLSLHDPTGRARCTTAEFHPLLADLNYAEDTDWLAAADNLAESIGLKVMRLADDVWVLAPRVGVSAAEVRAIAFEAAQETSTAIVNSLSRVGG